MVDEGENILPAFRVVRQDLFFQALAVKNMHRSKFHLPGHQPAVRFDYLYPKVKIQKEHGHKKADHNRHQKNKHHFTFMSDRKDMIFNLSERPSIANQYLAEMRDKEIQLDGLRFRTNLQRMGEILAYELSRTLEYSPSTIETPLGVAEVPVPTNRIVLATILRAGLPMHTGMLRIFDRAENAFVSAYRMNHKSGDFEINMEYLSCPDLEGSTLVICDAMLATGASMDLVTKALQEHGQPREIHVVTAIACSTGLEYYRRHHPNVRLWVGVIDDELTAKSYIVPGIGDAGDLSYGSKLQE